MRFDFRISEVDGGNLLTCFGGDYGKISPKSVHFVSRELILPRHLDDANCRVLWRSVNAPPNIFLLPVNGQESSPVDDDKRDGLLLIRMLRSPLPTKRPLNHSRIYIQQALELLTTGVKLAEAVTVCDSALFFTFTLKTCWDRLDLEVRHVPWTWFQCSVRKGKGVA